jgi:hypothetical protein
MPVLPIRPHRPDDRVGDHLYGFPQAHKMIRMFESGQEVSDGHDRSDRIDYEAVAISS